MTLAELRRQAPSWTWYAEQLGMGWRYVGTRGERRVVVDARAALWDDSGTEPPRWYAEERDRVVSLADWLMRNGTAGRGTWARFRCRGGTGTNCWRAGPSHSGPWHPHTIPA